MPSRSDPPIDSAKDKKAVEAAWKEYSAGDVALEHVASKYGYSATTVRRRWKRYGTASDEEIEEAMRTKRGLPATAQTCAHCEIIFDDSKAMRRRYHHPRYKRPVCGYCVVDFHQARKRQGKRAELRSIDNTA